MNKLKFLEFLRRVGLVQSRFFEANSGWNVFIEVNGSDWLIYLIIVIDLMLITRGSCFCASRNQNQTSSCSEIIYFYFSLRKPWKVTKKTTEVLFLWNLKSQSPITAKTESKPKSISFLLESTWSSHFIWRILQFYSAGNDPNRNRVRTNFNSAEPSA